MSISLLVAGLGCLGALAATGLLAARCLRAPSVVLVAWTVAESGLAISLLAQASGHALGFGPVAFRAMEIGAGVIAPLALAVGLTEVVGKSLPVRFGARLILPAIAFVDLVILGSDPLSTAQFSKAWPDPSVYYQVIPDNLLQYTAPIAVVVALIAALWAAIRLQRDRTWQAAVPPVAAAAATLAVSAPGLALLAAANQVGAALPVASLFAPLCVVAGALTWYACLRAGSVHVDLLRHDASPEDPDEWTEQRSWTGRSDETGGFEPLGADPDPDPYGGLYRDQDDPDYGVAAYAGAGPDAGGYAVNGAYRGAEPGAGYDDDPGFAEPPGGYAEPPAGVEAASASAGVRRGGELEEGRPEPAALGGPEDQDDDDAGSRLFGQIAIYTLLDDRVTQFDRLTRHVVREVRASEPDTLVFIVHAVPSAPMQRILYEVYRDRAAYEEHKRQPYLAQFEIDRRPYVLATNVIELGLQQAKVSPLPAISDLLTDTGFDLLNDTGFGQPGFAPRSAGRRAAGPGGAGAPGARRPR
jgi:quinol monooxygenase YgiN